LVYSWFRTSVHKLVGLFACMILLSSESFIDLVSWKSWLTSISSLVLHLAALQMLSCYLSKQTVQKIVGFVFFYLAASFAKESARACLLFTSSALIFSATTITRKQKAGLFSLVLMLWLSLFFTSNSIQGYTSYMTSHLTDVKTILHNTAHFAHAILGQPVLQILAFASITVLLYHKQKKYILLLWAIGTLLFYGLTHYFSVPHHHARALTVILYAHGLWFSSHRRQLAMPLAWLFVSFWPLAFLPLLTKAYGGDAAVAFSLLMGYTLYQAGCTILAKSHETQTRVYPAMASLAVGLGILLHVFVLFQATDYARQLALYMETVHSAPSKTLLSKIGLDVTGIRSWGKLYIDIGDRITFETYLALYFQQDKFAFDVTVGPPPTDDCYRLEAYTGCNYHIYPSEDPLNLWMPENVNPLPAQSQLRDPYFIPERWRITTIDSCESAGNWQNNHDMPFTVSNFPMGQKYYLNTPLFWAKEPILLSCDTSVLAPIAPENGDFALTFWLQSQRWSMIESLSVSIVDGAWKYTWEDIEAKDVNTWNQWKRVCLQGLQAQRHRVEPSASTLQFELQIMIKDYDDAVGSYISIDEIRLSTLKEEWRAP
jgi:hypothetical protein